MLATIRTLALYAAAIAAPLHAQHFRTPPDVDPATDAALSVPVALLPEPTTSFGAVAHDGWLYTLGGYTGTPHRYNRADQAAAFHRINLYDPTLVQALTHEQRMQSATLEAHEGLIIRIGGLIAQNDAGEPQALKSLATVDAFDLADESWIQLPPMPDGRSSHDTAIIENTLYVVGGWTLDDRADVRTWRDDIWTLNLDALQQGWSTLEAPFKRRAVAVEPVDGRLAVIGGMTPDFQQSSRVDLFDPSTGDWTRAADLPCAGFGVAATSVDGRIIASAESGEVFSWKPGADAWSHIATLTFPRFFHQLAPTPTGDILALGGISGGERPRHIERISLDSAPTNVAVYDWTIPYPGDAKNRQGAFLNKGALFVFGGNNSVGQHDFEQRNFLAEGWKLDLARLEWTEIASYPAMRQSMSTHLRANGAGVSIGGFGHDGEAARTQVESYSFDFESGKWSSAAPDLPVSRSQFGLAEHEGRLWIFGGLDYDPKRSKGDRFRHLTNVLVEEQSEGGGSFIDADVDLPRPRRAFGGAALNGRYFLIGGMRENFQLVEACDVFDFDSRSWTTISPPSRTRLNPELVALGGRLFLAGGSSPKAEGDGFEPNPTIEMYNPQTDSWSVILDEIPMPARHLVMKTFRGRLLLFSLHDADRDAARLALIDVRSALRPEDESDQARASAER